MDNFDAFFKMIPYKHVNFKNFSIWAEPINYEEEDREERWMSEKTTVFLPIKYETV